MYDTLGYSTIYPTLRIFPVVYSLTPNTYAICIRMSSETEAYNIMGLFDRRVYCKFVYRLTFLWASSCTSQVPYPCYASLFNQVIYA